MKKTKLAVVGFLLCVLLASGCSKDVRYRLPSDKTLEYIVSEQIAILDDRRSDDVGGEPSVEEMRKQVHPWTEKSDRVAAKFRIGTFYGQKFSIKASAHPPGGATDPFQGDTVGSMNFKINPLGVQYDVYGPGMPTTIRFYFPLLPPNGRRGDNWLVGDVPLSYNMSKSEEYSMKGYQAAGVDLPTLFMGGNTNIDIDFKYEGLKKFAGRKCALITGVGIIDESTELNNPDTDQFGTISAVITRTENYCFDIVKGYVTYAELTTERYRLIQDDATKRWLEKLDVKKSIIELVSVE